jgi:acetyl esterase/lipase
MRRRSVAMAVVCVAVAVLGSCHQLRERDRVSVRRDLVYADAPDEDGVLEPVALDLYTPADLASRLRPVVIWVHGGGFAAGDKETAGVWARAFAARGYVAGSIDYRMDEDARRVSFPFDASERARIARAVSDLKAAIRWFRAHAAELGVDPGRIAVGGNSAGAITSLAAGMTSADPGDTGDHLGFSNAVCTVIVIAGAVDPELITRSGPGAVFFHGDRDEKVPTSRARATFDALRDAGRPAQFHEYPARGHAIARTEHHDILTRVGDWLAEHLDAAPHPCV